MTKQQQHYQNLLLAEAKEKAQVMIKHADKILSEIGYGNNNAQVIWEEQKYFNTQKLQVLETQNFFNEIINVQIHNDEESTGSRRSEIESSSSPDTLNSYYHKGDQGIVSAF
jgi:hypothetical protein